MAQTTQRSGLSLPRLVLFCPFLLLRNTRWKWLHLVAANMDSIAFLSFLFTLEVQQEASVQDVKCGMRGGRGACGRKLVARPTTPCNSPVCKEGQGAKGPVLTIQFLTSDKSRLGWLTWTSP